MLRVGIIGCGDRGCGCFGAILGATEGIEIAALCDVNPVRMDVFARKLSNTPERFLAMEDMLRLQTLDAVVIATPDYLHAPHAVAALQAGKNVLIDKPLATTVQGCKEIMTAAENAGRVVMMGFNLRHHPVLKRVKELVAAGTIGKIFLMENREFYSGGRTYMSRWNRLHANSGGLWIHKGSHDFDIFNWLLDFSKPVQVCAFAGVNVLTPDHLPFATRDGVAAGPSCTVCAYKAICPDSCPWAEDADGAWGERAQKADGYVRDLCMYLSDKDTHDNGIAVVEYENGARASHMECFITSFNDRLYTIVGDKGQLEASLEQRTITIRPRWSKEVIVHQIPEPIGGHGGADPALVAAFIAAIRGEGSNTATLEHGLLATAIGEAAERSRRGRRIVSLSELL